MHHSTGLSQNKSLMVGLQASTGLWGMPEKTYGGFLGEPPKALGALREDSWPWHLGWN